LKAHYRYTLKGILRGVNKSISQSPDEQATCTVRWVTVNLYYAQAQAAQIEKYAHWCTFHRVEAPPILVDGCGLWFDDGGLALLSAAAQRRFI